MVEFYFQAVSQPQPGAKWQAMFNKLWPAYARWFLSEGVQARSTYFSSLTALQTHMPELVSTYETLCELAGGGDLEARFLSLYNPPPYLSGCSQAVWPGKTPMLVRNYDYAPALFDGVIMETKWNGRWVTGMTDCFWGILDGMNDAGLSVSLTFGGRRIVGDGFGVPLILRYVLEICDTVAEAAEVLKRVPCHMAYNVTVVDRQGRHITVYMSPDREAIVTDARVATNHQKQVEWHKHARATATVERERYLLQRLTLHDEPASRLIGAFLKPPLYSTSYNKGFGTLYTAAYWPHLKQIEYRWPGETWTHKIGEMEEGVRGILYPEYTIPSYVPDNSGITLATAK